MKHVLYVYMRRRQGPERGRTCELDGVVQWHAGSSCAPCWLGLTRSVRAAKAVDVCGCENVCVKSNST